MRADITSMNTASVNLISFKIFSRFYALGIGLAPLKELLCYLLCKDMYSYSMVLIY
jgi:hypothetical protein